MKLNDEYKKKTKEKLNADLTTLTNKLRNSNEKEAYYTISKGKNYQIGIGLRINEKEKVVYTIEFSFCVLDKSMQPQSTALKTASWAMKKLEKNRYVLTHLDEGWISGEKTLLQNEITRQYDALIGLLDMISRREVTVHEC